MQRLFAIAVVMSLWGLDDTSSAEHIIPKTLSSDGRYAFIWRAGEGPSIGQVILFDRATTSDVGTDLSQTDAAFRLIATSEKMRSDTPERYRPPYRVAWSEDGDMVAIHAGSHQYSYVSLFHRTEYGLETLSLPAPATFRKKIEDDIEPFQLSKLWSSRPRWLSKRRLIYDVSGSAFRKPAHREADFLDVAYTAVILVEDGRSIKLESIGKKESPTTGSRTTAR